MISVVICTYNRESKLGEMLDSFYRQRDLCAVAHEVIVVDNNSSDNTAKRVASLKVSSPPTYVFEPNQGLSYARNRGILESRGEIIAFLDDDVLVGENWLSALQQAFDQTGADVVGGRCLLDFRGEIPGWLGANFRTTLAQVDLGDQRQQVYSSTTLFGVNIAFRRSTLFRHEGFQTTIGRQGEQLLTGEETLLLDKILKTGGTVFYDPKALVHHIIGPERLCWEYFERVAIGEGFSQAICDRDRGRIFAFLRVLRAVNRLCLCGLKIIVSKFRVTHDYNRHDMRRRWIIQKNYLQGRWQRFLKRNPKQ